MKIAIIQNSKEYFKCIIFCMFFSSFFSCQKDNLDINPGGNVNNINYAFSIDPLPSAGGPVATYKIKKYSLLLNEENAAYPVFLLTGRDSIKNADITIVAKPKAYGETELNVNIEMNSQKLFYNTCNSQQCNVEKGSNTKGKYIKISFQQHIAITQKLVGTRVINHDCVNSNFAPIIFYYE